MFDTLWVYLKQVGNFRMSKQKILIVGGGFAGIKAALELCEDDRFTVTLISDRPDFQYYPTLYHTVTGGMTAQSVVPLETIFADKPVKLVINAAKTLDKRLKTLTTVADEQYEYDSIIFALGNVTNYFGIKGLEEYSYGMKSIEDIHRLKKHIHAQLLSEHKPDLHYVIVGGGPTGIELAGALPSYLHRIMKNHGVSDRSVHVDLVEGSPRLLPRMPKSTSRAVKRRLRALGVTLHLGKAVEGMTANELMISGKPIRSHTVIWTAGVANNPFFAENGFSFGPRGKVAVNVYLQADDNVYVLGDNANTPYSGMAQTAVTDASFVVQNLKLALDGKDLNPYKPKKPIYVVPCGHGWASVLWGTIEIYGTLGYALREVADAKAYANLEPLMSATRHWFTEFGSEENCPTCKTALKAQ